jgi:glycosyltransferase involved in cell wall biosynthesis
LTILAVADVNTIWHRRLAEALSNEITTIGLTPWRAFGKRPDSSPMPDTRLDVRALSLPPGWASRLAHASQKIIARAVRSIGRRYPHKVVLILTSPAYLPLARELREEVGLIYYCADDYRSYDRWGGERLAEAEGRLVETADACFFVSNALCERALREYHLPPQRAFISMNATEPRFRAPADEERYAVLEGLARPVVGVVGTLSNRIDFELLAELAGKSEVGTLLCVGQLAIPAETPAVKALIANEKCVITGHIPHRDLHLWTRAIDLAVIPYANSRLNHFCSPMRLFDHLASGRPIIATAICDQIVRLLQPSSVVGEDAFVDRVCEILSDKSHPRSGIDGSNRPFGHFWSDRARAFLASGLPA